MKRKRFSVEQIVAVLKQTEAGTPMAELIGHAGFSEQAYYCWKKQYAGLQTDQVRQLKLLQWNAPAFLAMIRRTNQAASCAA